MHDTIGSKSELQRYRLIQIRESHLLLRNLLDAPEAFLEHLYRYAFARLAFLVCETEVCIVCVTRYVAATLLEITYGRRLTSMDDELVQLAQRSLTAANEGGSPGSMLVDFFPVCKSCCSSAMQNVN